MEFGPRIEKIGTPRRNEKEWLREEEAAYEAVENNNLDQPWSEKDDVDYNLNYEQKITELRQELPREIFLCEDFSAEQAPETIATIYDNYAEAMRRRDREPLDEDRFVNHFFEGGSLDIPVMFGDDSSGYILGFWKHQIFVPTHFAPKTLRGGYELFKKLSVSKKVPVVLSITKDLKDTLMKMNGWHVLDLSFLAFFRDRLTEKVIVYNSHPEVEKRMLQLAEEFMQEREYQSDSDTADLTSGPV